MSNNAVLDQLYLQLRANDRLLMDLQDTDSAFSKYVQKFSINYILKSLNVSDRISLYSLLLENKTSGAIDLIDKKLPNLSDDLAKELAKDMEKVYVK